MAVFSYQTLQCIKNEINLPIFNLDSRRLFHVIYSQMWFSLKENKKVIRYKTNREIRILYCWEQSRTYPDEILSQNKNLQFSVKIWISLIITILIQGYHFTLQVLSQQQRSLNWYLIFWKVKSIGNYQIWTYHSSFTGYFFRNCTLHHHFTFNGCLRFRRKFNGFIGIDVVISVEVVIIFHLLYGSKK